MKNSVMYYRSLYYAILMVLFGVLGYLFLDSGFNTKTKIRVDYQDKSEVFYDVKYLDDKYNTDTNKYISNMVDYIDINYNYENIISQYVNGYYRYNVEAYLTAYEDNITNSLWERKHYLVNEKTKVLDENDVNNIKINDSFRVNFADYRDEINEFINTSNLDISGYLHIRINILEFLTFFDLENEYADNKVITINIPLTEEVFKINVNNIEDVDSHYDFSSNGKMNIILLIIGAFCLSVSVSLGVLVIRQFVLIYQRQSKYSKELKKILSKYDDCIVRVKRFYVNKKYNMIYVDNFLELMDVYEKRNKMISFKETKRGVQSIFVIIDEDDAWIYKLISDNLE